MEQQQRRRHPRKIAAWPAWVRFHRSARFLKGRTRDVSRCGAYIVLPLEEDLPDGASVECRLGVRRQRGGGYVIQAVNGDARVVRSVPGAEGGLAVEFQKEMDVD